MFPFLLLLFVMSFQQNICLSFTQHDKFDEMEWNLNILFRLNIFILHFSIKMIDQNKKKKKKFECKKQRQQEFPSSSSSSSSQS